MIMIEVSFSCIVVIINLKMAFNRYKGANLFNRNTAADAGTTILKLTSKILTDLRVDSVPSQLHHAQGVVRNSQSYSDPTVRVNVSEQGPHPAYYDPNTILQPVVRMQLVIRINYNSYIS